MTPIIITLAKEQGIPPGSFKKWKGRDGVPHKFRMQLLEAARRKGVELSLDDMLYPEERHKPKREATAERSGRFPASKAA